MTIQPSRIAVSVFAGAAMLVTSIGVASAAPVGAGALGVEKAAPGMAQQVRSRRGDRAALALGLGALGVIGGIAAAQAAQPRYYYDESYYYRPSYYPRYYHQPRVYYREVYPQPYYYSPAPRYYYRDNWIPPHTR